MTHQEQLDRDRYHTIANIGEYDGCVGNPCKPNPKWDEELVEAYKNGYDSGVWYKKLSLRKN